ncbi:M-phase phosphoprotein 8 isoform X7 [Tachysurus fulvidraco]|uniref:M-phase phosphoprotein 8 isoform X7 n=1 Tax=Tachysurus fulvidraco TaxID=1234273 RepID=UPI001FF06510|nr:M-phase phosphoprotein 8 isoform X7 [Tachysurus fulvidraco]
MDSCAERADPGDSEQDEEEDVYEVERIIDMRVEDGEILYRVRWKNYSSDDDTWEPKAHLEDCSEVLLAYERSLAEKKLKKDPSMKLPMKSELFDANSESDSDKDKLKESPSKKKKKKKKHAEDSEDEKSEKDKKKKKKKEKWKEDKPLPAPESDEEEERVPTLPPTKKDKSADSKKRTIEEDENDDAPAKKHKKEIKVKDGGKQKKEIVDERKKKKAKSKKEIESSGDETDKSDAPSELYTDDTSSTGNLSVTAKPTTAKTTDKSSRSESGSDHSKAKQKKNKSELKLQGFKDLVQDKNPKKTENSALLLRESGLNKLKSLTSSKSSSKSSRSEDEPDSSDAGATAKAKSKPKGLDSNSAPQKDLSVSSSSTVVAVPSKPREEEQLKEQKEETGEKGAAPNNLFEKFLLNCEAKDRVPRKQAAHTPKSSVKPDKKARKESPVQKTEFDKAKEGTIAMEVDERPEKSAQESEKSDRSNEPVAKMKEDVQREQKEEEQRRRKERLEEEEEKKRKEKLEESQRERKGKMEEAQKERQRLAEDVRLDWLDRRPAVEAMASTESTEDLRWKERRRKRREDSESRLLVTCDDTQDSQDPLERSDKTPDRGPPSLNLGVELNLDWMTLEDFQKHLNGEDENVSPLSLTPTELRDAVKNGNYMAVKRALSSKEDYNLDQQELLKRKLAMVGTIRKNRPELPPALLATRDRDRLSSQFAFTDTHTLVSYCPKKGRNVLLMSTLHQDTKVSTTEDKKPQIILDYHKNKRGVDNLDKVTSVYSCKQMTAHWPITVFYNMLDVSAYNSFVLWREINPNWKQRKCHKMRLFLEELGRELVTPLIKRHQPPPRTPASASIVREVQKGASTSAHLPKRRRCIFCTNDTKTSTRCQKCDVHICKSHSIITCQSCK